MVIDDGKKPHFDTLSSSSSSSLLRSTLPPPYTACKSRYVRRYAVHITEEEKSNAFQKKVTLINNPSNFSTQFFFLYAEEIKQRSR